MRIPNLREVLSAEEWALRCDLAAAYRLVALHGWSDLIFTHLTVRLPGPEHHFLINPYGLGFDEITASSLVKIDTEGNKLDDSPFPVNKAGFVIHSAIHKGREDVACVMHTHTRAGVAVSAQKAGLLPISQQASIVLGSLGYHDYEGIATREDEQPRLQKALGMNKYLMLRNHGLLTVGRSVSEAFLNLYVFEVACQIQIGAQSGGTELIMVDEEVQARNNAVGSSTIQGAAQINMGDFVWPYLLRKLDRVDQSYKT